MNHPSTSTSNNETWPKRFFAEKEFSGTFAGETVTGLAFAARLATMRLITSNWAWGGFAGVNTAPDHHEFEGGLFFRFFFAPRNAVCDTGLPSLQRWR
ncbi:cellulose synthase subunit BcsC-related outer membrane protein [Desulfobulbus alkaliphilus]|uniref:cellulose synthase subunit BcsC-related outer membrane protein n=1 Tax=Desulfobulbus alkaliphilus TaxID=869814 RepID=UPI0019626EC5|nr:cellulose synthase subunit BcsC-related outer membrane protein [Desulfobulbus alkaliphilus]MBM9537569.1 BCSC C-terminal domain-containing protein [Desulfobulbus alkaliphilus]